MLGSLTDRPQLNSDQTQTSAESLQGTVLPLLLFSFFLPSPRTVKGAACRNVPPSQRLWGVLTEGITNNRVIIGSFTVFILWYVQETMRKCLVLEVRKRCQPGEEKGPAEWPYINLNLQSTIQSTSALKEKHVLMCEARCYFYATAVCWQLSRAGLCCLATSHFSGWITGWAHWTHYWSTASQEMHT